MQPGGDRETVERWLKQFGMNAPGSWGNGITFVHPGAGLVLPPGVNIRPELPDDMSVDIHREGKKPAEITVKKGKKTWKATEDDLSKLPEDIRHEVEPLLHDGPGSTLVQGTSTHRRPRRDAPAAKRVSVRTRRVKIRRRIRRMLDGNRPARTWMILSRRLEEMRQTLPELPIAQQHMDARTTAVSGADASVAESRRA